MNKTKLKNNAQRRSKSLANYDRMNHRFSSPLAELHRSYLTVQRYRTIRDDLETKRQGLADFQSEQEEILAEYERYRGLLYNENYNVRSLYEQNQNKLNRTFAKLQIETTKLKDLTSNYKNVVKGMCALVNVAKIMDEFLKKSTVYKNFVDDAAKATKQFDTFSDIINKYNSLMSVFKRNSDTFNLLLNNLEITRTEIIKECAVMEEQLSKLMYKLLRAVRQLDVETNKTLTIERKLEDLQRTGFANTVDEVRINLYQANLLEALISSKAVDDSIVKKPFDEQIDIISEKFKMLTRIADSLNN